jgi:hypothetical protein
VPWQIYHAIPTLNVPAWFANSGERTLPACWFRHSAETNFLSMWVVN